MSLPRLSPNDMSLDFIRFTIGQRENGDPIYRVVSDYQLKQGDDYPSGIGYYFCKHSPSVGDVLTITTTEFYVDPEREIGVEAKGSVTTYKTKSNGTASLFKTYEEKKEVTALHTGLRYRWHYNDRKFDKAFLIVEFNNDELCEAIKIED